MKMLLLGKTKIRILIIVSVGLILAWTGFIFRVDRTWRRIESTKTIRIGYAVEAPYAFVSKSGEVSGESPELARLVASSMGITNLIWRNIEFGSLIDELESGNIDVIAAGLFITPERAKHVAFSHPTFQARCGLLVAKGNPKGLHDDRKLVEDPTARLAVLAGSVEEDHYRSSGISSDRLISAPDALTARTAVGSGLVDALALSSPTVNWMAQNDPTGRTEPARPFQSEPGYQPDFGAFAFRLGDQSLLRKWNEALDEILGNDAHRAIIFPLGFTADDIPHPTHGKDSP